MKKKYMPEIKICGITNLDDARAACDAGADYLGFVFYRSSPRAIAPAKLRRLLEKLDKKAKTVGVFVNEPADIVARICSECNLDIAQLCADESSLDFRSLPVPVWRVIRIRNDSVSPSPREWPAERYLVDAFSGKLYGGSGRIADWPAAARLARTNRIMLAGGLTPWNVSEAVRTVRPAGVDVSSGVECKPGKKDHKKIIFFIEAALNACHDN